MLMKISPWSKFNITLILTIFITFCMGIIGIKSQSKIFLGLVIAVLAIGVWILFKVTCPACGMPVAYRGNFGGRKVYSGLIGKRCANCNCDLTLKTK